MKIRFNTDTYSGCITFGFNMFVDSNVVSFAVNILKWDFEITLHYR